MKAKIVGKLRQLWLWSPIRKEALNRSRQGKDEQLCAHCRCLYPEKSVQLDHVIPVVKTDKITNWDDYISTLFYGETQTLCKECHLDKTGKENQQRKRLR